MTIHKERYQNNIIISGFRKFLRAENLFLETLIMKVENKVHINLNTVTIQGNTIFY